MTKKKNQDSKLKKDSLADIVRKSMIGKQQTPGVLKSGDNFCISGLLINHFAPDIDIEGQSWNGIDILVNRYSKYFSEEPFSSCYFSDDIVDKYVNDFKQYYRNTGRINLRILVAINDISFTNLRPFTFEDFANLFQEIGIKIEKLEPPVTNYKEDNVLTLSNVQLIEDKPILDPMPLFGYTNINIQNMNLNLDPDAVNDIMSKFVTEMFSRPSKNIIKTEHTTTN